MYRKKTLYLNEEKLKRVAENFYKLKIRTVIEETKRLFLNIKSNVYYLKVF